MGMDMDMNMGRGMGMDTGMGIGTGHDTDTDSEALSKWQQRQQPWCQQSSSPSWLFLYFTAMMIQFTRLIDMVLSPMHC